VTGPPPPRNTQSFPIPTPLYTDDEPTVPGRVFKTISGSSRAAALRLTGPSDEELAPPRAPTEADYEALPAVLQMFGAPPKPRASEPPPSSSPTRSLIDDEDTDDEKTLAGLPGHVMQRYLQQVGKKSGG
jgi:hypothetical protein